MKNTIDWRADVCHPYCPVLSAQIFSISAERRFGVSTLLVKAESQTVHPFFRLRVCNYTLQGKRDIEPAVHIHSKKTATVAFGEFGSECGIVAVNVIL
jgi:hypothetical protein